MRVGSGTPAPNANTSPVPSDGMNDSRLGAGVGHRRADQRLVAVVRQPHHEQRAALGDDGRVDFGRTLRHEAEEHAVLAAFLGDARQRAAGRAEADFLVGGRIAVRLLADEQQRRGAVTPQAEVEGHAHSTETTESTTSAGKPASCMMVIGLPSVGMPEQMAEHLRHGVAADSGVLEHEGVARMIAEGLDNDPHVHSAAVHLAGLYGTFRLRIAGGGWLSCRSAVIRAGTPYEFDVGGDPLGVFYLEPNLAGADALARYFRVPRRSAARLSATPTPRC